MAEPDLATLQHWMQGRVVADALPREAVAPANALNVREAIRGSAELPPEARLHIYARGYVLRLVECLRADFPVLHALVGPQVFNLFATAYLTEHRSRSPSLFELGAGFADYLEATRPAEGAGRGTLEAIPASLARLERAMSAVSRAPGPETQRSYALMTPAILLLAPGMRLRLPETVKLLRLDFDFTAAVAAADRGERPTQPPAQEVCVAVARSHYRVELHTLEPARFAWLDALGHAGAQVLEAVARAREAAGDAADGLGADLITWLPIAVQAGLVTPAETVEPSRLDR
jgi:hypothetical protein